MPGAVEVVIIQADALAAGIRLAGQVAQGVIGVSPQAHVGVIQGYFAAGNIVAQAGQGIAVEGARQVVGRVVGVGDGRASRSLALEQAVKGILPRGWIRPIPRLVSLLIQESLKCHDRTCPGRRLVLLQVRGSA
jgi:hypothetical protein